MHNLSPPLDHASEERGVTTIPDYYIKLAQMPDMNPCSIDSSDLTHTAFDHQIERLKLEQERARAASTSG